MKLLEDCFGRKVRLTDERLSDRQTERRRRPMADKVKEWFDAEADFLEVSFREGVGYLKETAHDAVMERVDSEGRYSVSLFWV